MYRELQLQLHETKPRRATYGARNYGNVISKPNRKRYVKVSKQMTYKIIIENNNKEIVSVEYKDGLIFTTDNFNSRDIFINIELEFYKSLLLGNTIEKAKKDMETLEDFYIKKHKKLKYIVLPLLWNKKNRKIIGEHSMKLNMQDVIKYENSAK